MSLQTLTVALIIYHHDRRSSVTSLLLLGMILALTVSIRVSGRYTLPLYLIFLLLHTGRWRRVGWVLVGALTILTGFYAVDTARYAGSDIQTSDQDGLYLSYFLMTHGLYAPANGTAAQALQLYLHGCNIEIEPRVYSNDEWGTLFWANLVPACIPNNDPVRAKELSALFVDAYVEALQVRPVDFVTAVLNTADRGLAYSTPRSFLLYGKTDNISAFSALRWNSCVTYNWCAEFPAYYRVVPNEQWIMQLGVRVASVLTQPHLLLIPSMYQQQGASTYYLEGATSQLTATVAAGLLLLFVWRFAPVGLRWLVWLGVLFVGYQVATVSVALQFQTRYADQLSVWYVLLVALLFAGLLARLPLSVVRLPSGMRIAQIAVATLWIVGGALLWQATIPAAYQHAGNRADLYITQQQLQNVFHASPAETRRYLAPIPFEFAWSGNFNESEVALLEDWFLTLQPELLQQAGMAYVMFTDGWFYTDLTEAQQSVFDDPTRYELVEYWGAPSKGEAWLYRVVAP